MAEVFDHSTTPIRTGRFEAVPPLENGDRVTAREFLRRYEAMPLVKKAELLGGIVFVGSPVRMDQHGRPDGMIQVWLGSYSARTPGVEHGTNSTCRLDIENIPQPDGLLRLLPECGGRSRLDLAGYVTGPPELVVEVCASSASLDLHHKLRAYLRSGVLEYLVWRTVDRQFDWFVLDEDEYRPEPTDGQGITRSRTFPGLWLDVAALLALDGAKVLDALQRGLSTPDHAAFLRRLRQQAAD